MDDAHRELHLGGPGRERPPIASTAEAERIMAELRWHREIHIADPILRHYLDHLDDRVLEYLRRLDGESGRESAESAAEA
ncbi:MAG: hypothetical protein R3F20_11845 [Planctomycetota bacterium]